MGIGFPELIIIFLVALFIFGAKRLPDLGAGLGKAIRSFNKGLKDGDGSSNQKKSQNEES